jgi:hypothetical protein
MLLSRHHNAGQIRDIKIGNRSFENVSQLKYLGTTVTNQNLIQEEIRGNRTLFMLTTIRSRNVCLLVRHLSKNVKTGTCKASNFAYSVWV